MANTDLSIDMLYAARAVGGWTPATPMNRPQNPTAPWHRFTPYYCQTRGAYAADDAAVENGDLLTAAVGTLGKNTEQIVGFWVVWPQNVAESASDYWTVTAELDGTEVCSRDTQLGCDSGAAWEVSLSGSVADRDGAKGETLEVIFTATQAGALTFPSGVVLIAVTREPA